MSFSFFGVIKKPGYTLNPVARVPPTLDRNVTIKLSPKTTKTIHWKKKQAGLQHGISTLINRVFFGLVPGICGTLWWDVCVHNLNKKWLKKVTP